MVYIRSKWVPIFLLIRRLGILGILLLGLGQCAKWLNTPSSVLGGQDHWPPGRRDTIYQAHIYSVQCAPEQRLMRGERATPIRALHQQEALMLQFDVLDEAQYKAYYAEIHLCRADGSLANHVLTRDYLNGLNYFPIQDYQLSSHTDPAYARYRWRIAPVKQSGNYLLRIRDAKTNQALIAIRFSVYESLAKVKANLSFSNQLSQRNRYHRLVVRADYTALKNIDPYRDFYVVLRQNGNPHTDRVLTTPTRVDLNRQIVEFAPIDGSNEFEALLPFRRFDLRPLSSAGFGIDQFRRTGLTHVARLNEDQSRKERHFTFQPDLHGGYRYTPQQDEHYVSTLFTFFANEPFAQPLYVIGQFNLWNHAPQYQLHYDSTNRVYRARIPLKQGYYDYLYSFSGDQPHRTEGAHFLSENQYEVFIYLRPFGAFADPLVGYTQINERL